MADAPSAPARLEGRLGLHKDGFGSIRVAGARPLGIEQFLNGRDPLEAINLTQQISADSGVSHALAAALALDAAANIAPPHNGRLLRDLLHLLSFVHAHLRNFYFQSLPDYIPMSALAAYDGKQMELARIARGIKGKEEQSWAKAGFRHPFRQGQLAQIAENQARSLKAISTLQQMMAAIGGKFPIVMSIVPGGMTTRVTEGLIIRLRGMLHELAWFVSEAPVEDALVIIEEMPELLTLGRAGTDLISAGTLGDDSGPDASMFPRGALLSNALATFQAEVTEAINSAYYRIPLAAKERTQAVVQAPDREGAYSWIKSPRYVKRPVETGALARLMITHQAGSRSHTAAMVEQLGNMFGPGLDGANTVAGRLLARLGELQPLLQRCDSLLDQLTPGQPAQTSVRGRLIKGNAAASIESPAGMIQHRAVLQQGKIAYYDIIGASTWNGAPRNEEGRMRGLELALNAQPLNLRSAQGRREASRIVHSYFFSATDAVQ